MRRCLSVPEVRQLLSAVDLRSPFGQRDYLLIMFLYQTGLRVGECSRLLTQLVSSKGKAFRSLDLPAIFCKGPRGRVVPLNATARACVEKQLAFNQKRGFSVAPAAPLFQNRNHTPLSVRSIQKLIAGYRVAAGLEIRATPHTLHYTMLSPQKRASRPASFEQFKKRKRPLIA